MGLALPPLRSSALPTGILSSAFRLWSDHFFVGPLPASPNNKKTTSKGGFINWSGQWDSDPRHQPWQGCALPLSYTRNILRTNLLIT